MLVRLAIRDIVLIDRLDLDLDAGLTVLTGETGAGKSILLDAFALALGARGDGSLVRQGQTQGQVTAAFELPSDHPVRTIGRENGIDTADEIILRRIQMADGRTRAFVNDQPTSAGVLRTLGRALVEIHGQHDDRALIDPTSHRVLVDSFGGALDLLAQTRAAHRTWRASDDELLQETAKVEKARTEADYLAHAHEELARLAPASGEEAELADRRAAMMQAEKVAADLSDAHAALTGDGAACLAMAGVIRRLERRAAQAPHLIEPVVRLLDEALEKLDAATAGLEAAVRAAEFEPRELEKTEERLFALRGAGRKYACGVDDLPALAERFATELASLNAGEERLAALQTEVTAAQAAFAEAAAALSSARKRAALELDAAVNRELAPLKLDRAKFLTEIVSAPSQASADGIDRVEFWVQTNPGTRAGPLMKVASGGELARFMLALKVVLAMRGSAPTLVFDEIDTGVGGAVADSIGQRLGRLAGRAQVLAVTHAPQVAARAGTHLRIAKSMTADGASVITRVIGLSADARREEIARMLAGATITDEARAAASRLIETAA